MSTRMGITAAACGLLLGQVRFASAVPPRANREPAASTDPAADQAPLPAPVQATVSRRFPSAKVLGFEHQVEDRRHLYFVDLQTEKGEVTLLSSGRGQYLGLVQDDKNDDSDDVFIEPGSAPQPVKGAIVKHFNNEPVDKLFMEVEDEKFIFCAEQTKNDITKWLSFSPQGELIETETEVPLKELPSEVQSGIKKSHAGAKLDSASFVKEEGPPAATHYSVEVIEGKDKLTLTVTPEGQVQSAEPTDDASATKP